MSTRIFTGSVLVLASMTSMALAACGSAAELSRDGRTVQTGAIDGRDELGRVEVQDGDDCGGFRGSYVAAHNMLRNRAADMGAAYVKITETERPHTDDACTHNRWTLRGTAYRDAPPGGATPLDDEPAAPATTAPAPITVDVPPAPEAPTDTPPPPLPPADAAPPRATLRGAPPPPPPPTEHSPLNE